MDVDCDTADEMAFWIKKFSGEDIGKKVWWKRVIIGLHR